MWILWEVNRRLRGKKPYIPKNRTKGTEERKQVPQVRAPAIDSTKSKGNEKGDWTKVVRKKAKKKAKVRIRPEAIVISSNGSLSYAEILKKVKADPDLKDLGGNVSKIRRTQKGDLMFELKKTSLGKTDGFRTQVKNSLGENVTVRTQKHEVYIQCKDLDEVTSKGEICTALMEQFKLEELAEESIVSLRKAYGNTQTATLRLPVDAAQKLLAAGKVRIGWVVCRLREQISLKRCFKCLAFGHFAKACTSGIDRSDRCRRCGEKGHIAKACNRDPKCLLCEGSEGRDYRHIAGSGKCPEFRKALTSMKK